MATVWLEGFSRDVSWLLCLTPYLSQNSKKRHCQAVIYVFSNIRTRLWYQNFVMPLQKSIFSRPDLASRGTMHLNVIWQQCMQCIKFAMWLLTALLSTQSGNAAILFIACLINVIWYQLQCAWWNLLPTSTVLPESCHIPLKLNCSLLVAALHAKPLWYVVKQASVSKYQVHCSLRQCLHFCTICMPGQRTTSAAKADLI